MTTTTGAATTGRSTPPVTGGPVSSDRLVPCDQLIDITALGDSTPRYIVGFSGRDAAICEATAWYVAGKITAEEFEEQVEWALTAPQEPSGGEE